MREIYIFDIDGCVMPSIFKNFNIDEPRKRIIREAIKNGNQVKLYPEFIEFYKKHYLLAESIYFLTGRKYKEFGKLTENQLQFLRNFRDFQVIYYPERKSYRSKIYFAWKVKEIKKIIKNSISSESAPENYIRNFKFNIFDDMSNHFPKIRKIEEKWCIKIHLIIIKSENIWNRLL